jgi:hypothetical protein
MELLERFMMFYMFSSYSDKSQKFINIKQIVSELCMSSSFRMMALKHTFSENETENTFVRFEVFTAVMVKNAVFWDVMSCGSC